MGPHARYSTTAAAGSRSGAGLFLDAPRRDEAGRRSARRRRGRPRPGPRARAGSRGCASSRRARGRARRAGRCRRRPRSRAGPPAVGARRRRPRTSRRPASARGRAWPRPRGRRPASADRAPRARRRGSARGWSGGGWAPSGRARRARRAPPGPRAWAGTPCASGGSRIASSTSIGRNVLSVSRSGGGTRGSRRRARAPRPPSTIAGPGRRAEAAAVVGAGRVDRGCRGEVAPCAHRRPP